MSNNFHGPQWLVMNGGSWTAFEFFPRLSNSSVENLPARGLHRGEQTRQELRLVGCCLSRAACKGWRGRYSLVYNEEM